MKIESLTDSISSKTDIKSKNSTVVDKDEVGRLTSVFEQLSNALERSEQNQKQMIDSAAHELRTPVTIIQGQLEAAIHELIPTDKILLDVINKEILSLSTLIEDLQLLSLAGSGGLSMTVKKSNIEPLIQSVISQYSTQLTQKGISTELDLEQDSTIFIDEERFSQIIKILLNNSYVHARDATAITFNGTIIKLNQLTHYQLDIWDDGLPIKQAIKTQLFNCNLTYYYDE